MPAADDPRDPRPSPTEPTTPPETGVVPAAGVSGLQAYPEERPAVRLPPHPAPAPAPAPAPHGRGGAPLVDKVLAGLTVLLAVFIASQPVRNSDLYMHLATGRALVNGEYGFGTDPFGHTTEGVYWVNHNWLTDTAFHGVYSLGEQVRPRAGIPAVAALKSLLVGMLALVLVLAGRRGRGLWLPAACAALAMLAMGPRIQFVQPAVVSMLFLGLTVWFLQRGGRHLYSARSTAPAAPVTWTSYWPLLVLFALWANLDDWFFLGPVTVGLFALGQFLQARFTPAPDSPRPGEVGALAVTFALGLAACLLNPHHIRVFTLPTQLGFSDVAAVLQQDPVFRELFRSPFDGDIFRASALSVTGLAYLPLAVLALLSFGLNYAGWRWWRALVFLPFLALGAYHERAMPFFAVVAGSIMALNFHDFAARRLAEFWDGPAGRRWSPTGRGFTLLALAALIACAWPGWLNGRPFARHRVAWVDEIDPSLRQTALFIKGLHEQGALGPDSRGLNLSPEIGTALAWYCPGEKIFFDHRYALYKGVARDVMAARRALLQPPDPDRPRDWKEIPGKLGVDYLIVHALQSGRLTSVLGRLWDDQRQGRARGWALLYLDGRSVVLGQTKANPALAAHAIDFGQLAYAPAEGRKAPPGGMGRLPRPRPFWEAFYNPLSPPPLESDAARLHLLRFEMEAENTYARRNPRLWLTAMAVGVAPGAGPSPPSLGPLFLGYPILARTTPGARLPALSPQELRTYDELVRDFIARLDRGPPEMLLLATRAARRALPQNPDDHMAHFTLGQAYLYVHTRTREAWWADMLGWVEGNKTLLTNGQQPLAQLRRVVAINALENALLLDPDLAVVHYQLADLYGRMGFPGPRGQRHNGFKDLQLKHLKAYVAKARAGGPPPRTDPRAFAAHLQEIQEAVNELGRQVDDRNVTYKNRESGIPQVLQRAQAAWALNLGGKALEVLLASDSAAFGARGVQLQVQLALCTGRAREVRAWLEGADLREVLGEFLYRWDHALLAVVLGDYEAADEHLLALADAQREQFLRTADVTQRMFAKAVLDLPRDLGSLASLGMSGPILAATQARMSAGISQTAFVPLQDGATLHALRGILALEAGNVGRAEDAFRQVLALTGQILTLTNPNRETPPAHGETAISDLALEYLRTMGKMK